MVGYLKLETHSEIEKRDLRTFHQMPLKQLNDSVPNADKRYEGTNTCRVLKKSITSGADPD